MKKRRDTVTVLLMVSSIGLLLVLQVLWVRSAYTKASEELRRETSSIFRMTVLAMRDSVIQQTLETWPVNGDPGSPQSDSVLRYVFRSHATRDTARSEEHLQHEPGDQAMLKGKKIQIEMLSPDGISPDSFKIKMRSFGGGDRRNFIFRLGPDSLKIDSIAFYYRTALAKAHINLPFAIIHPKRGEKRVLPEASFTTEPVRINPAVRYAAIISGIRKMLFVQILPQALFSLFLTLLTTISFYVMYRNIRRQQKLVDLKNDFISNITHELKTPITTVSVAIEALRNFKGLENPQLTNEYLEIAQNELTRLSILTDKVLKMAIFENKGVSFEPEELDMVAITSQILSSMRLVFEKSGTKIAFVKEGTNFIVHGDKDHLTNVIYNLIDNALKYSPSPGEITILLKEKGKVVSISVADNGPGIAAEFQKKIFEKFFRVPTGDVHNIKGYGLGLSYVDSVIRQHQGTIDLISAPGKGSTFVINLQGA